MTGELQSTEPDWKHSAQELHKALWLALHEDGGEIVLTKEELDAVPPLGKIEWLTGPGGILVISAIGGPSSAKAD